mmetsp:Transcript_21612/g.51335  ORF Transcript_21612/g.51335 Transcript_21612/m.51335 type:complete len:267 (-) Transcript_21612:1874-2674(-)
MLDGSSAEEGVPGRFEDEDADDDDEDNAHETGAVLEGQPGAEQAAGDIGQRHHRGDMPPDVALADEQRERERVGHQVHQLGGGRGAQEVIAQQAHEQEDEEAAGSGPEQAIVKAHRQRDAAGSRRLGAPAETGLVLAAEVLFCQRVDEHRQQHQRQGLAQARGADKRQRPGAGEAAQPGQQRGRHQPPPGQVDALGVLQGGPAGAPDAGTLVGAQQRGRHGVRVGAEQRRHQHQATAAGHRIDEACKQGGGGDGDQFKHGGSVGRK